MTLLELQHVSKSYPAGLRPELVLDGVSLRIQEGEVIGLWGDRRSGKSTLLRIMAGSQAPDSGTVRFEGRDIASLSASARAALRRSRGIALISEWRPARDRYTVEDVARALLCERMTRHEARQLAHPALERVGMGKCAHIRLSRLSPGELLRVGLAKALIRLPRLLLVDEPALVRSPSEGQELSALLREIGSDRSLALLIASEDPGALRGTKRMLAIGQGRVVEPAEPGVVLPFTRRVSAGS